MSSTLHILFLNVGMQSCVAVYISPLFQ